MAIKQDNTPFVNTNPEDLYVMGVSGLDRLGARWFALPLGPNGESIIVEDRSGMPSGMSLYSTDQGDFTAAVATDDSNVITVTGLPFVLTDANVRAGAVFIKKSGETRYHRVDVADVTVSGSNITFNTVSSTASGWSTSDTLLVALRGPVKAYDRDLDVQKVTTANPPWSRFTTPITLVSAQDLTGSYADFGGEINKQGYTHIEFSITSDVNSSTNVFLKALGKNSYGATNEYEFANNEIKLWSSGASDNNKTYILNAGAIPFIQLQAKAGTVGGTAGDLTITIVRMWNESSAHFGFQKPAPTLDFTTNSLVGITHAHHEIHEGDSYVVSAVVELDTTSQKWLIETPDTTKWAHMVFDVDCTGEMLFEIYEGADRVGDTALTEVNRNRNSVNTAGVSVHQGYTGGTTDGTLIYSKRTGATGVASKTIAAGGARGVNEFVLKQNTKYVVVITTYADDVFASLGIDWYEHTDIVN